MKQYGLIGRKLGHSFSARFFNGFFRENAIDADYSLYELSDIREFPHLLNSINNPAGLNVTVPYKSQIIPFINSLTPSARSIGAVNCVKVNRYTSPVNGKIMMELEGHNTDSSGFRMALESELKRLKLPHPRNALILGTGGASKAVCFTLEKMQVKCTIVSRKSCPGVICYKELTEEIIKHHKLIVNCTPLGMWPDIKSFPNIPYSFLDSGHLCFDLVYNPDNTEFMKRSSAHGAKVCNGLEMLENQALLAWDFWQKPFTKTYLANQIKIINPDGTAGTFSLSMVEIEYDFYGNVLEVNISPFKMEMPGVEYLDGPLIISPLRPLKESELK